jgi:hypothetical protein
LDVFDGEAAEGGGLLGPAISTEISADTAATADTNFSAQGNKPRSVIVETKEKMELIGRLQSRIKQQMERVARDDLRVFFWREVLFVTYYLVPIWYQLRVYLTNR